MLAGLLFAFNALLNFALTLVLARLLPPDAFGALSLILAAALFTAALGFEWVRLSAVRYLTPAAGPALRATLDLGFLVSIPFGAVVAIGVGVGLAGLPATPLTLAALALLPVAFAGFEYLSAVARNRFDDRTYLAMAMIRHVGTALVVLPLAGRLGDPALVALLLVAPFVPCLAVGLFRLRERAPSGRADARELRRFAVFGLPLVVAASLDFGLGLVNRSWLAWHQGLAAAGAYTLVFDVAFKLLGVAAASAEAALVPRLMTLHEAQGDSRGQLGRNLATVLMLVAPIALGLVLAAEPIAGLLLAPDFRAPFVALAPVAVAAGLVYALQTYALRPVVQVAQRTNLLMRASLVAFAVDLVLLALMGRPTLASAATAHLLALLAGILVSAWSIRRDRLMALPVADLCRIALALALAAAPIVLALHAAGPAAWGLPLAAALGAVAYAGAIVGLDALGTRALAHKLLRSALPRGRAAIAPGATP